MNCILSLFVLEELHLKEDKCYNCPFHDILHPKAREPDKEVVILNGIGSKYALHFRFNTQEELDEFENALKPLGYSFRFPMR